MVGTETSHDAMKMVGGWGSIGANNPWIKRTVRRRLTISGEMRKEKNLDVFTFFVFSTEWNIAKAKILQGADFGCPLVECLPRDGAYWQ